MTATAITVDEIDEPRSMEARGAKLRGRVAFVTGGMATSLDRFGG